MVSHELSLVFTLTGGLTAALVFGVLARAVGLSPIVGYLLAGVAVGPHTPGFVADAGLASGLAEVGVILLMFGVGLHFHARDLLAVRRVAVPGAVVQIVVATALGAVVTRLAGFGWAGALVFGLAISVASTVVLTRVLEDGGALQTPVGHLAVGWLIVEDLFTVLVLVLLPDLVGRGASGPAGLAVAIGLALLKLGALVAFTFVVGQRAIPRLLGWIEATGSRELFTLAVLVLALGIAVGAAQLFGASMALGAFLAGMVVGQSDFGGRAAVEALPMRDAFAVLFFVSVGMLLDPEGLLAHAGLSAAITAVVVVGKPLVAVAVTRALGQPLALGLPVSAALAQIGEFSFIVVAAGRSLGVLPESASQVVVVVSVVSITLAPLAYRSAERLARWTARAPAQPPAP
jgi:CPA2 family monovalent cation:H+ antiporter-2